MADPVVVLEPGDERAQKIAKAMGSRMASDILQLLGEGSKSLTEISERLSIPMNTAKYHVENLLECGLVSVEDTRYSVKGREVKIYSLTNQLLIVAPRQSNVRSLLLKYASLFGIVAFCSAIISVLSPVMGPGIMNENGLNAAPRFAVQEAGGTYGKAAADGFVPNGTLPSPDVAMTASKGVCDAAGANVCPAPEVMATLPPVPHDTWASSIYPAPDTALAFFLGGVLVIFILICYEAYLWKKRK